MQPSEAARETVPGLESLGFSWETLVWRLIAAAVIIVIAIVASRLLQIPIRRILDNDNRRAGSIYINLVRVLVWTWALCGILDVLFDFDMAGVLSGLGIVGIAVSLGAQQTIANVIGGLIVSLSKMVGPGDWISVQGNKEARFVDTNWRQTTLEDEDGIQYAVPNSYMVSNIVAKKLAFFTIVTPFSLKVTTPEVEALLNDVEQVLLDRQVEAGIDFEQKRPKASVVGAALGSIQCEVKLYVDRKIDTRSAEQAVLPALINLLQERDALADLPKAAVG